MVLGNSHLVGIYDNDISKLFTALVSLLSSYNSSDKRLAPPDLKDLASDGNSMGDLSLSLRKCVRCLRSLSRSISCR